jgi:hypothetical protein
VEEEAAKTGAHDVKYRLEEADCKRQSAKRRRERKTMPKSNEDRKKALSAIMRDTGEDMGTRLRASEFLGRCEGDFSGQDESSGPEEGLFSPPRFYVKAGSPPDKGTGPANIPGVGR